MNWKHCITAALFITCFSACKKNDADVQEQKKPVLPAAITSVLKPVKMPIGANVSGYYVAMPSNYDTTSTRYPLLIFLPGAGQFGNGQVDLPSLLNDGPVQLVDEKKFPGTFSANGKVFSFILFTPQFRTFPSVANVNECIEFVKSTYRIDTTRIYISGLSIGAELATEVAAAMPSKLAAVVPLAGVFQDYATTNKCQAMASTNLPVWAFHSQNDPVYPVASVTGFVNKMNSFNPINRSKATIWPTGGHDAWTRAIEPAYKENGMNIYEWMLQFHR